MRSTNKSVRESGVKPLYAVFFIEELNHAPVVFLRRLPRHLRITTTISAAAGESQAAAAVVTTLIQRRR